MHYVFLLLIMLTIIQELRTVSFKDHTPKVDGSGRLERGTDGNILFNVRDRTIDCPIQIVRVFKVNIRSFDLTII